MSVPKRDIERVRRAYATWREVVRVFDKLPPRLRLELGNLIECRNTGVHPPGRCIENAFLEWFEGGRA